MATPMLSLRVPLEQQDIVRRFAKILKTQPELIDRLERQVSDPAGGLHAPVGPFRNEEAAIGFLRDRLVFALKPEEIWLFGSRARRDHRDDSDFDILVVLPDGLPMDGYDYGRAAEAVVGSGIPSDIVPCSMSEFTEGRPIAGTIANEVMHHGRLLYRKRKARHGK